MGAELRLVRVGKLPASRQGGSARIFAPQNDVRVGAQSGCASQGDIDQQGIGGQPLPGGGMSLPCDGLSKTQPKPLGSGDVTVNATTNGVNATLLPKHMFVVIDYGINDPSGVLLVTAITAGTDNLMEGGSIRTNTWQSAKTACPIQKPFTIYPWSGLVYTFNNTTSQNITINVWALGYVIRC